jgi:AraC-like DNA-binding protein
MPETLFALDRANFRHCQDLFRGECNKEYYRGDFWVEDDGKVQATAERKAVGPHAIILTRSAMRQFFRRTQKHIREDASDISVLWFVRRGRLVFSNQCGRQHVAPGEFLISRSTSPFFIELQPDDRGMHEVLHVTVPTHLLRRHIVHEITTSIYLPAPRSELRIAESILAGVFAEAGMGEGTGRVLVEAAFTAIGDALRACESPQPPRQTLTERRLEEVLRFIEVHLSDPNLSATMVSQGCGISPRYLSLLLRLHGRSFSALVWEQRMEMARSWLASTSASDISIGEIAYGTGFKSPAHFSRMFKRVFEVNPRDYRTLPQTGQAAAFPECAAQARLTIQ